MWTMDDGIEVNSSLVSQHPIKPSIFNHLLPEINNNNKVVVAPRSLAAVQSSRWSPTAEQLMGLEELYRHGTRTPTAFQIQEITAKLRRFGKIEGKNVFYWFQNHKARDKKKQRLKLEAQRRQFDQQSFNNNNNSKTKLSSVIPKVTTLHVEKTKREPLSNCSTISEESGTAVPRATTQSRMVQVDKELKIIKSEEEKNYVSPFKPYMEMPFCFPIINLTRPNTVVSMAALEHNNNKFMFDHSSTMTSQPGLSFFTNIFGNNIRESHDIQTLDLFPLQSEYPNEVADQTSDHHHHHDYDYEIGAANCGHKLDLTLT